MKFSQLIEYNVKRDRETTSSRACFLFFKKAFYKVKASDQHLSFVYFGRPHLGHTIKTNLIIFQTVDPDICSNLIFYKRVWDCSSFIAWLLLLLRYSAIFVL